MPTVHKFHRRDLNEIKCSIITAQMRKTLTQKWTQEVDTVSFRVD